MPKEWRACRMLNVSEDIQFQIECLSTELVEMLMQKYGWDMKKALDELYSSETYKPEFGISDSRFSCYARFPTCAYYICPPNNMDGKMQNCKVQMKFTL